MTNKIKSIAPLDDVGASVMRSIIGLVVVLLFIAWPCSRKTGACMEAVPANRNTDKMAYAWGHPVKLSLGVLVYEGRVGARRIEESA